MWITQVSSFTTSNESKYGVLSGPYFPLFGLNRFELKIYSIFGQLSRIKKIHYSMLG